MLPTIPLNSAKSNQFGSVPPQIYTSLIKAIGTEFSIYKLQIKICMSGSIFGK